MRGTIAALVGFVCLAAMRASRTEVSVLMTKDLERKPSYDALDELINHEWKTKTVVCVKNGKVAFRGFRGKYRLTWKCVECGKRHSHHVVLMGDGIEEAANAYRVKCPRAASGKIME